MAAILKVWCQVENPTSSISACLLEKYLGTVENHGNTEITETMIFVKCHGCHELNKLHSNYWRTVMLTGGPQCLVCATSAWNGRVPVSLTFADHIRRLTGRCFHCLGQLRSIRRILTTDTIITLVNALVVSRIDYCNAVLAGVHDIHLRQLQRVLNAAARVIWRKRKFDSISATVLHWLPIQQRVDCGVQAVGASV